MIVNQYQLILEIGIRVKLMFRTGSVIFQKIIFAGSKLNSLVVIAG